MGNQALRELLRGKRAHTDSVACLEDLAWPLTGKKIDGYPHSIFQIVGHLNYWMEYELKRIDGKPPAYPDHAIESWPQLDGPATEEEWQDVVEEFRALLDKFTALSDSGPEVLNRKVMGQNLAQESESSTVEAVLWQTVVHNSYHLGQVALLRRAFGAWPPRCGSDTW